MCLLLLLLKVMIGLDDRAVILCLPICAEVVVGEVAREPGTSWFARARHSKDTYRQGDDREGAMLIDRCQLSIFYKQICFLASRESPIRETSPVYEG